MTAEDQVEKRCDGCPRPVCQRKITLRSCIYRKQQEITGEPLDGYGMHDLFCGC